ncbi:hypothetical protein KSP40_PGU005334 [Platanthera guangdongensis]|uniref:Chlorophyll a-b binding protein, chloroplastic n=1 Tax=Platanthera guangdongensis TaxID=2320717 RepID=A0ABR2MZC7_9ASPA
MDYVSPGSQAEEGTFLGLEAAFQGVEPGYPGGPILNPLGLAKDIRNAHQLKLKEIKNERLAMVAMLGFFVQAYATHAGPIDNLLYHLQSMEQNYRSDNFQFSFLKQHPETNLLLNQLHNICLLNSVS